MELNGGSATIGGWAWRRSSVKAAGGVGSSKTRILLDLFPKDVKDFFTWCLLNTTHDGRKKMVENLGRVTR